MKMLENIVRIFKTLFVYTLCSATLLFTLTLTGLFMSGCGPKGNEPNIEIIQGMMEQPALKAQDFDPNDREKSSMLVPPAGSWPKNVKPYLYYGKPVEAGQKLVNPYAGNTSDTVLKRGEQHYKNFCLVCHGPGGKGDGPVAPKFQGIKPPSILTDKIRNYSDGRIFDIITQGQGLMGTYIHQLPKEEDRWAVVNYVRKLQKQGN